MRGETPKAFGPVQLTMNENMATLDEDSVSLDNSAPGLCSFDDVEMGVPEDSTQSSAPLQGSSLAADGDSAEGASSDKMSQAGSPFAEENRDKKTLLQRILTVKLLVGLLLVGFIVFIIVDSATTGHVREVVESFLDWIEENPIGGFFAFVIGTYFASHCLFPHDRVAGWYRRIVNSQHCFL